MHRLMSLATLAVAALLTPTLASPANAFGPCCCFCQAGRCQVKVEKEEVETKEFVCKCETICVPPLRFPWECGPLKKCGKVRQVKVLGTEKSKETICTYQWSATAVQCCPACRVKVRAASRCGQGCVKHTAGHSGAIGCQSDCNDSGPSPVPAPTPVIATPNEAAEAAETAAFAQRYPAVRVAVIDAIRTTAPDADGWVTLSNHASQPLAADVQLIEATESAE